MIPAIHPTSSEGSQLVLCFGRDIRSWGKKCYRKNSPGRGGRMPVVVLPVSTTFFCVLVAMFIQKIIPR